MFIPFTKRENDEVSIKVEVYFGRGMFGYGYLGFELDYKLSFSKYI